MKKIRKSISILLCIAMILSTNGMITFADSVYEENIAIDSNKIMMQLKEDLGEENANKIINIKNKKVEDDINSISIDIDNIEEEADSEIEKDNEEALSENMVENVELDGKKSNDKEEVNDTKEFIDNKEQEEDIIEPMADDDLIVEEGYIEEPEEDVERFVDAVEKEEAVDVDGTTADITVEEIDNEEILFDESIEKFAEELKKYDEKFEDNNDANFISDMENENKISESNDTDKIEIKSIDNGKKNETIGTVSITNLYNENFDENYRSTPSDVREILQDNKILFGTGTMPWVYWYIDGTEIHYSGTMPTNPNYVDGQYGDAIHPFISNRVLITKAIFDNNVIALGDTSFWFSGFSNMTEIENISYLDTSNVTDMGYMFNGCSNLTSIDVSNWDTSSVTNMSGMFSGCSNLTSIDVSNWDTSSVTDMSGMFSDCTNLTSIDVSNWDTSSVTDMMHMFGDCINLTNVNTSSWDTSLVTKMGLMFDNCRNLTSIDVSNWDTSSVTNMSGMFSDCTNLTSIDVSNWNTSSVTDMDNMFYNCSNLTSIDVSNWNTNSVKGMDMMFYNCSNLTSIDVSNWDTSSVTDMMHMFGDCSNLMNIDVSNWNTSSVTNMGSMFYNCSNLTSIDVSNWNTNSVVNMSGMFYGCSNLIIIDANNWDTSSVIDMHQMFDECSKLASINVSGWNTNLVTNMSNMFYGCNSLTEIDLSSFYTNSLLNCSNIFYCTNLEKIDLSNFNITNISLDIDFFWYCHKIKDINISESIASVINNLYLEHDWKDYAGSNIYLYDNENRKTTLPNIAGRYVINESATRFTVTYNSNGGSYVRSNVVNSGDTILEPLAPTKTGFEFAGWYYEDSLVTPFVFSTPITNNITLYAKWEVAPPIYWYIDNGNTLHLSGIEPINPDYISGQTFYSISSLNNHPWASQKSSILTIEIDNTIKPFNCRYLFAKHENLISIIGLNNIDTSKSNSMQAMFYGCKSIIEIDISSFDTSKVTTMRDMFHGCSSLSSIVLTGINTSNVISFSKMFYECKLLNSIDLSNFDNFKANDMSQMFEGCEELSSINLSNFNTNNVIDMSSMFRKCSKLATIDVSSFNTSKVYDMSLMFACGKSLSVHGKESILQNIIGLNNFNTNRVVDMNGMFYGDENLISLDLSSFNTSRVQDMADMFFGCASIITLDLSNFDTLSIKSTNNHDDTFDGEPVDCIHGMFFDCRNLNSIYVSDRFNVSSITHSDMMFSNCYNLIGGNGTQYDYLHTDKEYARIDTVGTPGYFTLGSGENIPVSTTSNIYWKVEGNILHFSGIALNGYNNYNISFSNPSLLPSQKYDITKIVIDNNIILSNNYSRLFMDFVNVIEIENLTNLDTSNVTDMSFMFYDCSSLTSLDLSTFETKNVTMVTQMFSGCRNLRSLNLSNWDISNIIPMIDIVTAGEDGPNYGDIATFAMFDYCDSLLDINMTNFKYGKSSFCFPTNIRNINFLNVNTENLINMSGMFAGCKYLTMLDLSIFDTGNVTDMSFMFNGCNSLSSLDLSSFNMINVATMSNMFWGCSNLSTIRVSNNFNVENVTESNDMFFGCVNLVGGNGTYYDSSHTDKEYARIDRDGAPGYFTLVESENNPVATESNIYWKVEGSVLHLSGIALNGYNSNYINSMNECSITRKDDITKIAIDNNIILPSDSSFLFYGFSNVNDIENLINLNTGNVTDMSFMFSECTSITTIDLSNFDMSNVMNMSGMFYSCVYLDSSDSNSKLTTIIFSEEVDTSKCENMSVLFGGCVSLTNLNLTNFDTTNVKDMSSMFQYCNNLITLDLSNFITSNVTSMAWMFLGCENIVSLDLSNFNTINVNTMLRMFEGCRNLSSINVSNFDTKNVYSFTWLFNDCSSLEELDLSSFNTENAMEILGMFAGCINLKKIIVSSDFNIDQVEIDFNMFFGCVNLVGGNGTYYDSSHTDKEYARIDTDATPGYFTLRSSEGTLYVVKYDMQGHGATPSDTNVEQGLKITKPINPIETGYTFKGWYKEIECINEWNFNTDVVLENVVLYAKWENNIYMLKYNNIDNTNIASQSILKIYDVDVLLDIPSRIGYTFIGWYEDTNFNTVYDGTRDISNMQGDIVNIYAKWQANSYILQYDLCGVMATTPSDIIKYYDSLATLSEPTNLPSGYSFVGWYKEPTYINAYNGSTDLSSIQGDVKTIYAKWKRQVIYNANGHGSAPSALDVESGTITLENIFCEGYTFNGWYEENTCDNFIGNAGETYTVIEPMTLYAKWTANTYTITYEANGGTVNPTSETKVYDSSIVLATPSKVGYTFVGWYKESGLINVYDGTTDLSSTQNDNKIIYAKYNANQYNLRFNIGGVLATTPSDIIKAYGTNITLPEPTNIPNGYTFVGWYKENALINQYIGNEDLSSIQNDIVILYAKWKARISYNANGHGTAPSYEDVVLNDNIILPSMADVTGYTFDSTNSWYEEAGCTTLIGQAGTSYTVTEPKTLYAKWNETVYTITYHNVDNIDGVTWQPTGYVPKATRSYTEAVTLPTATNLSKFDGVNNYLFKGWYDNVGLTGSPITAISANTASDKEYFAKWNASWIVKYDMQGHGATPSSINVEQGLKVTRPTNPTEVGYTFKDWFTDTSYTTEWNFTTMPVTENMILYAKWEPNTYTIRYNSNGGTITPTQETKTYNTNINLATPSKIGYTFDGWYKESSLINTYDGATDLSTSQGATVNIYAKWNENSYTLKLNPNFVSIDGTGIGIETSEILTYTQVKQLSNPFTSDKYNFVKWNTEANGTGTNYSLNQNVSKLVSEDGAELILYAQWQAGTYIVKFDKNGGTSGTMANKTYTCDIEVSLPTNSFVKIGYKFIGWATSSNANVAYIDGQNVNNLVFKNQTITLYAKWEEIKYNLILDPNVSGQTGTVTGSALTLTNKTYEENIILNNSVPFESTTHSFGGWSKVSGMNNTKAYDEGATVNKLTTVDGATITLYAKWIPGSYKVIFNGNGATSGSMGIQSIEVGKSAQLTANAYVKTGYTFIGWATMSNATIPIYTNAQMYSDNTAIKDQENILYAVWKVNIYNIKYNSNGGTISPTTVQKTYGNDIILASPSRTGYTFVDWYKEGGLINVYDGTEDLSTSQGATVNIYAKWSENLYNITLHENGGIYGSTYTVPSNRLYTKATTLPSNTNVIKTGYTFGGWYDNSGFTGSAITSIPANTASNKEYWLKWNENSYTITYNTNGGTFITALTDADKKRLYTEGKTLKTDITKEGYTFGGWYEMPDFTDPQSITNVEANTTANKVFYAKWNIETYTVSFDSNGGSAVANQNVLYNQKATKPINPTKSHAIFKYWYITDENVAYNFDTAITGNLVLIAKYDVTHEVTFNTDGGTTIQMQQIIDGNKVIKPSNPTKDQHRFIRWYKNGESDAIDFDFNTPITSDIQLNAKWEAIQTYTVSFNMNGVGVAPENQYVVENTKAIAPINPTTEGFTFVRWYTTNENVAYNFNNIVTANIIINAKWNENSYTISYNVNGGTFITVPTDADKKRLYTESKTLFTSIERDGFIFDGWYENSDFSGIAISTIFANTAKDYKLYAKWHVDPNKKQVSFNSNGGLSVPALAATSGNTITAPTNPIKSGYTFEGWFTDIELTHQFDFATPITESIILYAKWNQNSSGNNSSNRSRYDDYRGGGGGGGGGGSGGGSGARNKNDIKKSLPNSISTTTTKVNMKSNISTTLHSENTTWNYDPVSNKWGLYINDTQTKANNGFYKISEVENQVINDITIPTIVESTYCFDENGNMLTGWVQTLDNVWYFFDTVSATLGKEINNTWKLIDGVWYYFGVDGKMYQNTAGIPGYLVDANGALIDYTGAIAQILSTLYNAKSLDGVTSPIG